MSERSKPETLTYHGVTTDDMPGKDPVTRSLNFSLFRRGKLQGYLTCKDLFGEGLKKEFARLNAKQRKKSLIARDIRQATLADMAARADTLKRARALPPADPKRTLLRMNPSAGGEQAPRGCPLSARCGE
jgi:hypothetical protein